MERLCDIFDISGFGRQFFWCLSQCPGAGLAAPCSAIAWLDGESALSLASLTMVPSVGLQGGYVIGRTGRDLLARFLADGNGSQSQGI
jgi:hypothetical protein